MGAVTPPPRASWSQGATQEAALEVGEGGQSPTAAKKGPLGGFSSVCVCVHVPILPPAHAHQLVRLLGAGGSPHILPCLGLEKTPAPPKGRL